MIEIGRMNTLQVTGISSREILLEGGARGDIPLPRREAPGNCKIGDTLRVFLYTDADRKIVATVKKPAAMAGEYAWLRVAAVESAGAFMEWGLKKDLFVPFSEQKQKLQAGKSTIIYIYFDTVSGRLVGSTKLHKYFSDEAPGYAEGAETDLLVSGQTETFYKVIVDNAWQGVLYKNEVFQKLQLGQKIKGYVKKVREDNKIDLLFHKPGYGKVNGLAKNILQRLEESGGYIAVNDKSTPQDIYDLFGESKSTFKNAVGLLYKKRKIVIEARGIRLAAAPDKKED